MENRDKRRAMRHLQRAQELLGFGMSKLNFGVSDDESDTGPSPGDIASLYMDKTLPVYEREHAEEQMRKKRIVLLKHNSITFVATVASVTQDPSEQSI